MENLKDKLMEKWDNFDLETKINVVNYINGYDGAFDDLSFYYNDNYFFQDFYGNNVDEVVRAVCYGNYNYTDEYVRINAYGNLDSFTCFEAERELDDWKEEIIDTIINDWDINNYDVKDKFNLEKEK